MDAFGIQPTENSDSSRLEKEGRILVVDDEEGLRHTFVLFLQRAGYRKVRQAASITEAKAIFGVEEFDLVVSDIVLSDGSGIDLLRFIRGQQGKCPVVMVTGYPNIETAAEAVRLGAYDYLAKPVKKNALLDVCHRALAKHFSELQKIRVEQEAVGRFAWQKKLIKSVPSMIIVVDRTMRVLECNELAKAWCAVYLPQVEEGRYLAAEQHPLLAAILPEIGEVLHSNSLREKRIEWQKKDARYPSVLVMTVSPLAGEKIGVEGVVITAFDEDATQIGEDSEEVKLHHLYGLSPAMRKLYRLILKVAPVDSTVLITGESGCGKGLVADAIHRESRRKNKALVKVDCAALADELLESELFGHSKGAFTGADSSRPGRILQADGGTLFLDEIGDISTKMQLRLLRFLQEKVFYPVGRDQPVKVDVRVIAATNADLQEKINQGLFREDLYFRLRVVEILVPPLRQRRDDVPFLANRFFETAMKKMGKNVSSISTTAMQCLTNYSWPGNVRELEHVIERAVVLCDKNIVEPCHLPQEIVAFGDHSVPVPPEASRIETEGEEKEEARRLVEALKIAGGNKAKAARSLGIDRSTLYRKLQSLGIGSDAYDAEKFSEY